MKHFLAVAIAFSSALSMASTINSIEECTVDLYYSNPWKSSYSVKGTRITGKAAASKLMGMKAGASVQTTKDILGVERFDTITKKTVLDTRGTDVNSCSGVTVANKKEVCTTDSNSTVCETFCSIEWQGVDCR